MTRGGGVEEGGERTDKGKFPEGSPRRRVEGWESCQDETICVFPN